MCIVNFFSHQSIIYFAILARQEEATVKRIKLEYDELGGCSKEYMGIWDLISTKDNRITSSKCDNQMLLQAIRQGLYFISIFGLFFS